MEKRINELISICEDNRYTDLEIKKIKKESLTIIKKILNQRCYKKLVQITKIN